MLLRTGLVLSTLSLLFTLVNASGKIVQIVDATDFCVFLPPNDATDRNISDSESDADAFCMGNTPLATGADKLPSGFILSAHYVKTDNYVQVTGQIDPSKANLLSTDDGGQYDIKAPNGASCAGWDYFVELIEPTGKDYCIRCCNNDKDCNRGISEAGCARIVPGDYSGPLDGSGAGISSAGSAAPSSSSIAPSSSAAISSTPAVVSTSTVSASASISSVSLPATASIAPVSTPSAAVSPSQQGNSPVPSVQGTAITQSVNSASLAKPASLVAAVCLLISITVM